MQTDPVCSMRIDEKEAAGKAEYQGKQYYFCSDVCRRQFEESPERYAQQETGTTKRRSGGGGATA
jgi:YHS domain-containing protein